MTDSVVVEGYARLRDGKKWKTRWLVLRKPSPVADCLVLLVFKDKSDRAQGNRERASVTLEELCGLETGQCFEGVTFTLAILCLNQTALLGFDTKEALLAWEARLRYSLGEVHRFCVAVLPGTKLESGPATLHLCNNLLALARDVPPVVIGHWNLPDLRRYGPVPNGFVFEGGTRCGYWAGVFLLASGESEQISFLFDCVVRGISPTRGPFGLRPVLPDPSLNQTNSEEKLNHEAQELEKRLSMLSHRDSTISSTYCPSAGGDDRSISGSSDASDTSQSDCSIGSRLVIWSDPAATENSGQLATKCSQHSTEKLSVNQGGGNRPVVKAPRQLQEIGRQSSSDSGIATGSHSSYSGSFSSYTGSLDINPTEDFGSVFNLPPHLTQDLSPCTCPAALGHEYQVPNSLRYLYDTPRSLLQDHSAGTIDSKPSDLSEDSTDTSGPSAETEKEEDKPSVSEDQTQSAESLTVNEQSEDSEKSKVVPSSDSQHPDSCHICSSLTSVSKTIVTICSTCGGYKTSLCIPPGGTATQSVPADEYVDKSLFRSIREVGIAADRTMEMCASHRSTNILSSKTKSENSLLPKKGRDKLVSLLIDLLGYPRAEKKPEGQKDTMNCYESMNPVFWTKTCKSNSQCERVAAIYENCVKCEGEHCQPPPRPRPPIILHNRSVSSSATSATSAPPLKTSQELVSVNEQVLDHSRGSQREDVPCHCEETNGPALNIEDKCLFGKDERRRADGAYEVMEGRALEKSLEGEEKRKYELMGSSGQQKFFQETQGTVFVFPPEAGVADRLRTEAVTYVNIPVSPTSKKQLNYMELELQELGPGARGATPHLPAQRKCSTKYAQIDITATETAHKVGTQHALGRQEGLHTLELRRKATPH